ncbi:DEAD/DEAH box helicase [Candidatus Roizmanbacteria bacterium]|nr:DEAD/DEAH box helicase [Candidatus Roizmanbacteria bacterium]
MYKNSYRPSRPSYGQSRFNPRRFSQPGGLIDTQKYIKKAVEKLEVVSDESTCVFADFSLPAKVLSNLTARGYTKPTPIQEKAIPSVLEGKDVIGIANTGTGKTGAFLIPLIDKIMKNQAERIIVMVPTRELGQQIQAELRQFAVGMPIFSTLCIGGANIQNQIYQLRRQPHFVIGTPGRLKDLIERKILNMQQFHTVILDEADRMVDMGFIQDITYLLSLLPQERQSLCFSATISAQVNTIIQSFLKNPITVSVRSQDTSENVEQNIVRLEPGKSKIQTLEKLLEQESFKKVLIFGRTKRGVEQLATHLHIKGFRAAAIHGDKTQQKREQAIRLFKDEVVDILVATDVAARGLDISGITHVINYDEPATYDDYIHRIGRTGRGNQKGHALTFV